jgi:dienelactone hydrolase
MPVLHQSSYTYRHAEQQLEGYVAYDESSQQRRPAVLVVHDWSGRNMFACQKADLLARLGYVGFAVDMYGDGRVGETTDEKMALMQEVLHDRVFLRARILSALDAVLAMEHVDRRRVAVIGFCFGGLCALELARSGADIRGAVSFHGLLNKADGVNNQPIKSKVLALHGYDDPMVTPESVNVFGQEMTDAGVDWQIHMYGQTMHGFTNPVANDAASGIVYNPVAERRSIQSMTNFLQEVFM